MMQLDIGSIVSQVPGLAVLVYVVMHFLRHLERSDEAAHRRYTEFAKAVQEAQRDHSQAIQHLAQEIAASKQVNARLTQVIMFHDATVKGKHPGATGDPDEIVRQVLRASDIDAGKKCQ